MNKEEIINILKDFQILSQWESSESIIKSDQFERIADRILQKSQISDEEIKEPIQDALYATGKFTTDECDELSNGILQYLKETWLKSKL